eukprot:scaffold10020_cov122-Isochrysis_galbana.AAC.1
MHRFNRASLVRASASGSRARASELALQPPPSRPRTVAQLCTRHKHLHHGTLCSAGGRNSSPQCRPTLTWPTAEGFSSWRHSRRHGSRSRGGRVVLAEVRVGQLGVGDGRGGGEVAHPERLECRVLEAAPWGGVAAEDETLYGDLFLGVGEARHVVGRVEGWGKKARWCGRVSERARGGYREGKGTRIGCPLGYGIYSGGERPAPPDTRVGCPAPPENFLCFHEAEARAGVGGA